MLKRTTTYTGWSSSLAGGSDADFGALPSEREYLERTYDAGNSFNRDQKTYEHI